MIRLEAVSVSYPPDLKAVDSVDLAVDEGEFVAIVGPSGCGKTTLLNLIAGLRKPEMCVTGRVAVTTGPPSAVARPSELGYVFEDDALLPWRTARQNIELSLTLAGVSRGERCRRAEELLRWLRLDGFGDYYPHNLSLGMKKRVALGRALAHDPQLLLLDDPFSSLDVFTRVSLQADLLAIWHARGMTTVLVTHDIDEALSVAQTVVVLSDRPASVLQVLRPDFGSPRDPVTVRATPEFLALSSRLWLQIWEAGASRRHSRS